MHQDTAPQIAQIPLKFLDGRETTLAPFMGRVLLIVNTASRSPLAPQMRGLERLYEAHRREGLTVLGFPTSDFGHELEGGAVIESQARDRFGVSFPLFEKIHVGGEHQHPLYAYLTNVIPVPQTKPGGEYSDRWRTGAHHGLPPRGLSGKILGDFEKFLVSRQGEVVARFAPDVGPEDVLLTGAVEKYLRLVPRPFEVAPGEWLVPRP